MSNFQAKNLMDLVGKKKPSNRYKKLVVSLLNTLRDYKVKCNLLRKEREYLLNQIKERDLMIDSLKEKNLELGKWKDRHENKSYPKLSVRA